jgi:hypothetical protein
MTYSLAGGDLEDLGRKSDGALHAKLLIFGAIDEVIRDCFIHSCAKRQQHSTGDKEQGARTLFKVLDVAASEGNANFVEFCGGHGAGGVVFLFAFSDVTHIGDRGD